jgi:hypothetical protein
MLKERSPTQWVKAMSLAFEGVCTALEIRPSASRQREAIAVRIIELARRGERSPTRLLERVLREAGLSADWGSPAAIHESDHASR